MVKFELDLGDVVPLFTNKTVNKTHFLSRNSMMLSTIFIDKKLDDSTKLNTNVTVQAVYFFYNFLYVFL